MAHTIAELQCIVEDLRKRDEVRNGPRRPAPHPATISAQLLTPEEAEILARMQTPKSRAGIEAAFRATPDEIADAAVAGAMRGRG